MSTEWIEDLLRLNARILAAQAILNTQGAAIVEMMEAGEDTSQAEALYRAYRNNLRRLRRLQDVRLDEVKDDV